MSRRGMVKKRCTSCGRRVPEKRCDHCGSDRFTWSFTVDTGPPGGPRKQVSKSGFKTKSDAVAALADIQSHLDKGTFVEPSRQDLGEYLHEWLGAIASTIRPTTLLSYRMHVSTHIVPYIGSVRLESVDGRMLNGLYSNLLSSGRADGKGGLAPASVRRVHATIHRALKDAVRWGHLFRNPADQADPPRGLGDAKEMKTWTAAEVSEFLRSVRQHRLYAAWLLAVTTGARRGEILGLRWPDVDFDRKRVSIQRSLVSVGYEVMVSAPKTQRGKRQVALDEVTVATLRKHRKHQLEERISVGRGWEDSDFVFTREDGHFVHPDRFSKLFNSLVRASGLARIRLHDLRHTYATLALQAGIHPKVVSERLGHASVSITLDTYSHAVPALQEDAAERVAELLFGS